MVNKSELAVDVLSVYTRFPGAGSSTTAEGLAFVLKMSGFDAVFLSISLRSLALALGAPTKGEGFLKFLESEFIQAVDPVWDGNHGVIQSIRELNSQGKIVIAESKVGPVLSVEKRELLRNSGFEVVETGINMPSAKFVYLNVGIATVMQRMIAAGRKNEFDQLRTRVQVDRTRYLHHYGFDPYNVEMGIAGSDVSIDTSKLSIFESIRNILINLGFKIGLFKIGLETLQSWETECGRGSPELKTRVKNYLVLNDAVVSDQQLAIRVIEEMRKRGYVYQNPEIVIA